MAAEIRVDTIKSRSGINTFYFGGDALTFHQNVGIGTTIAGDPVTSANTGKLSVGIISCRSIFSSGGADSNFKIGDSSAVNINRLTLGISSDLQIYHQGSHSFIEDSGTGTLKVRGSAIEMSDTGGDQYLLATENAGVNLYHNGTKMFETTADSADFGGTGAIGITKGTTAQRPGSAAAGDFRYNTDDGKFEGYTGSWGEIGGGGGVSQVSGIVSTTSTVGFAASFAIADFRSASVNFLINDATGASQAGKYLMVHDKTTVTVVEQVAVATGSMLGTVSGAIVSGNAELQVTMNSAGVATCSAKIDTMADFAT